MRDAETWMEFRLQQSRETPGFAPEVTVGVEALARVRDSVHRPWVPESVYVCPGLHLSIYINKAAWKAQAICPPPAVGQVGHAHDTTHRERVEADQENLPRALFCFISVQNIHAC